MNSEIRKSGIFCCRLCILVQRPAKSLDVSLFPPRLAFPERMQSVIAISCVGESAKRSHEHGLRHLWMLRLNFFSFLTRMINFEKLKTTKTRLVSGRERTSCLVTCLFLKGSNESRRSMVNKKLGRKGSMAASLNRRKSIAADSDASSHACSRADVTHSILCHVFFMSLSPVCVFLFPLVLHPKSIMRVKHMNYFVSWKRAYQRRGCYGKSYFSWSLVFANDGKLMIHSVKKATINK